MKHILPSQVVVELNTVLSTDRTRLGCLRFLTAVQREYLLVVESVIMPPPPHLKKQWKARVEADEDSLRVALRGNLLKKWPETC